MSMLLGLASVYDVLTFLLYRVYLCICQYCWDHPVLEVTTWTGLTVQWYTT
jgi:hypothetical protein